MVSTTYLEPVANRLMLLTNLLSTVKIDKLVVPEVVGIDCGDAVLNCSYSGAGDDVTVLWLHNGSQVYERRRGAEPEVWGVLEGRYDVTYGLKNTGGVTENRPLRISVLALELSGEYTCVVRSRGQEARAANTMIVFSPERDFELTFKTSPDSDVANIKCAAKRIHPRPDMMIEYNKTPISQQQQRTWREGAFFDAECLAAMNRSALQVGGELACRLQLPQVDYTAITKKYLHFGNRVSTAYLTKSNASIILSSLFILMKLIF